MAKKKKEKIEKSPEELRMYIAECEERYKQSFHTNSCKEIMNSWYALKAARDQYYKSINKDTCKEESNQIINEINQNIDSFDLD